MVRQVLSGHFCLLHWVSEKFDFDDLECPYGACCDLAFTGFAFIGLAITMDLPEFSSILTF